VLPAEVPAAIERLLGDMKDQSRARSALQLELAQYRADELAANAELIGSTRVVLSIVDADANALKTIAGAIAARPGHIAVAVSKSTPALVVVARGEGVTGSAQQVIAALIGRFGGRGGGRPELAQAGGLAGSADEIVAAARAIVSLSITEPSAQP